MAGGVHQRPYGPPLTVSVDGRRRTRIPGDDQQPLARLWAGKYSPAVPAPNELSRPRVFTDSEADNTGDFTSGDWLLFISISVIWGASFLLIAFALEGLVPSTVTLGRVGLGAATLWGMRTLLPVRARIAPEDWPRILVLSLLWVAVPFTLFPLAQQHINSAVTGLLNGGTPVFVALISVLFLRRRPGREQLLGIALGFVGISLISLGAGGGGSSELKGVLMVLGATLCYGVAITIAAPMQQRYGAIHLMSWVLGLATLWTVPWALVGWGGNEWRRGSLAATIVLGVLGTGIAYWIMATLVGRIGAIRGSFITYLIPVVSLILGVVFRNDAVSAMAIAGAALTITGALLASRSGRRSPGPRN